MERTPRRRTRQAAVGGALGVGVVAIALLAIGSVRGFPSCTASASFGWLVAILAGAAIGASGAALLATDSGDDDGSEAVSRSTECVACGHEISEDWRLCPHCGELLACDRSLGVAGGSAEGGSG